MEVISTRRYEARPPANSVHPGLIFDPQNSIATIKEEEWETRKKKEITTTRQIETRVKRQVVLEDGEVVKDSGPLVTTNTTEDVEQQEHTTQERKTNGDDPKEIEWPIDGKESGGIVVQKELNETVIRSREETEELLETEDRRQLGDITDEAYQQAIKNNRGDIRISLAESSKQLAVKTGPRVVQHTTKSNKVIDTEKTLERKELKPDGQIVTETKKTVEHEEIRDVPADENAINNDDTSETKKESSQRFLKKREEDVVDYISGGEKIAREMRYVSEITEGERIGDWPPPPDTMRTVRLPKPAGLPSDTNPMSRKDALTKKPLDPEEEDEARKFETSKWLENHFGSESRSSHSSDHDNVQSSPIQTATNTSFINVTMKSCTPRDRDYKNPSNNNNNNHNHHHHQQQQQQQQQQRKISARESGSPSGYFHGISEWSERFQGSDNLNGTIPANSSKHYVVETSRTNGSLSRKENPRNHGDNVRQQKDTTTYTKNYETTLRKNHESHNQHTSPPSPPVRRRLREQVTTTRLEEKNSYPEIRGSSPVNVVQRTWENRSREKPDNNRHEKIEIRHYSPVKSRSPSPVVLKTQAPPPVRRDKKKSTIDKSNQRKTRSQSPIEQTKSKIGESFRKLVGKLRSVSSERKNVNKKNGSSSVSQLTQTDDDSTYLQYNVIDKNIPEIIGDDEVDMNKPPERPPRSLNSPVTKTIKVTRTNGSSSNDQYKSINGNSTPHRYYISEESYSSSKNPYETRINDQRNHYKSSRNNIDHDSVNESSTLDRFSKSTSRLINGNDNKYYSTTQTLPKKLNYKNNTMSIQSSNYNPTMTTTKSTTKNHTKQIQTPITSKSNQSRHYNSMINISIKNSVTSPTLKNIKNIKNNNNHLQNSNNKLQNYKNSNSSGNSSIQDTLYSTVKHDNNYKTSLLRSKSFNVEANNHNNNNNNINNKNINGDNTHRIPYKSNTQLNRLDETPPLKSPGILASISRSNRDLFRHDYY